MSRSFIPAFALVASIVVQTGCTTTNAGIAASPSFGTVDAYVAAYNARDLEAMLSLMHEEVQWLSVEGSEVAVFADGKDDLSSQMAQYFASPMATISRIEGGVRDGRFIAVREVASWTDSAGEPRSQSAMAIYEIDGGLVRRVWYYPSSE